MPTIRHCCTVVLLGTAAALLGCSPKTDVSLTGNVPAQYSHVFVTAKELWFNSDANAGPDDTSWRKFPLTNPVMVDLATATQGTLAQLTTGLALPAGVYTQLRLIPVDASAALVSGAPAGAKYNFEVDYVDSSGATQQAPLELQNPDKGIGIAASITIEATVQGAIAASNLGSSGTSSSSTSTTQTDTGFFRPLTSTGTTASTTTTTSTAKTLAPLAVAISLDAGRDVAFFTYSGVTGALLNPHTSAYNTSAVGAIQGSVSLSALNLTTTNDQLPIEVTAEALSADGSRHVVVNSAPVSASGTFVLYPLPTSSSSQSQYDLVIHGPGIATIIVKNVPVNVGNPSTNTPVSIGTVAPRAAGTFNANLLATAATPPPAGALVGFYQTLPGTGEVPYVIEERPIDPFSRTFATDQALAVEKLDFGTFFSGSNVTLTAVTPVEGVGTYRATATAPLFTDGVLTTTVSPPAGNAASTAVVEVPALTVASGATSGSMEISLRQSTPGKYDKGELILSQGGAIVATASLDGILAQAGGGTLALSGLPGGTASTEFFPALYYVSVRSWNSNDPAGSLNREIYPQAADLRHGSITGYSVNID